MLAPDRLKRIPRRLAVTLYRRPFLRRVARPLSHFSEQDRWVFVIGCYNSGTTLLRDLIARSKHCSGLPGEGVFLTSELVAPDELGWTRLWWKVENQIGELESSVNTDIVKKDWGIGFNRKSSVLVEKSVSNALRIRWLNTEFNHPKFVYIIRNGYAVSEGIRRRAGKGRFKLPGGLPEYPIEWCIRQWVRSSQVIEEQLFDIPPEQVLRLTYEELCEDPNGMMRLLGNALLLEDLEYQDLAYIEDMNLRSIERLSPMDIRVINDVAADTLRAHGYPIL